jgi:tetratricopeptide (TPR) repeat protein
LIVEDGGKKKGGREYTVTRYRTAGVARVETSFDVVDLETSRLLVSTTCRAERRGVTQYGESAQALNESEMMRQCYEEIVDLFMQKIAPFSVQADHALLHIKENIQNENGIALVQAGRHTDAVERFESALNAILNNPSAKPGDKGKILHNRAVALELLGKYEEAISSYYAAMDNNSGPKDATNIARCEERQNDQKKLKEQGVKPTGGGSAP